MSCGLVPEDVSWLRPPKKGSSDGKGRETGEDP